VGEGGREDLTGNAAAQFFPDSHKSLSPDDQQDLQREKQGIHYTEGNSRASATSAENKQAERRKK
jgi:hypothetical protein